MKEKGVKGLEKRKAPMEKRKAPTGHFMVSKVEPLTSRCHKKEQNLAVKRF
jgi:hypothetical protein